MQSVRRNSFIKVVIKNDTFEARTVWFSSHFDIL